MIHQAISTESPVVGKIYSVSSSTFPITNSLLLAAKNQSSLIKRPPFSMIAFYKKSIKFPFTIYAKASAKTVTLSYNFSSSSCISS